MAASLTSRMTALETSLGAIAASIAAIANNGKQTGKQTTVSHNDDSLTDDGEDDSLTDDDESPADDDSASHRANKQVRQQAIAREHDRQIDSLTGNEGFPSGKQTPKGFKPFGVKPKDRKRFMEMARKLDFIPVLEMAQSGSDKRIRFTPNSGTVTTKGFSSGNHGLYGQVSYSVTLPSGEEYVLAGQVQLTLSRRKD